jgi:hypothetical protein
VINNIDSAQLGIKITKKAKPPEQIGCCCIKKETSKQDLNKTTETSGEIEKGEKEKMTNRTIMSKHINNA